MTTGNINVERKEFISFGTFTFLYVWCITFWTIFPKISRFATTKTRYYSSGGYWSTRLCFCFRGSIGCLSRNIGNCVVYRVTTELIWRVLDKQIHASEFDCLVRARKDREIRCAAASLDHTFYAKVQSRRSKL